MKASGHWTIEGLFAGRSGALALFQAVRSAIESIGPIQVETSKTQVSFKAKTKFAWVWLPQIWIKKRPENSVTLTFDLARRVRNRRIAQAVEPRPGRWTHHVVIENKGAIDSVVRKWLSEAYALGSRDRKARGLTSGTSR